MPVAQLWRIRAGIACHPGPEVQLGSSFNVQGDAIFLGLRLGVFVLRATW